MIERTRYATEFRETETGAELWRSGRFIGEYVVPEGRKPFPDREAVYEVVTIHDVGETRSGDETVLEAARDE